MTKALARNLNGKMAVFITIGAAGPKNVILARVDGEQQSIPVDQWNKLPPWTGPAPTTQRS